MPRRVIAGFPVVERVSVLREFGLRAVPKTSDHARGYIAEKRVTIGARTFAKGAFVPRRFAEEKLVFAGKTFDARAKERFETSGARTGMSRYNWALGLYMESHPGLTRGQARTEMAVKGVMRKLGRRPEADFYTHLWQPQFKRKPSKRAVDDYIDALIDLGLTDEADRDYYEEMFG